MEDGIILMIGRIALASPKLQLWIQIPFLASGGFLQRKNRAGIDWEYLVLKAKRNRKGSAKRYNSTATAV